MADLSHVWSNDLSLSASGDLLLVDGPEAGRQRVIRRLLSNPGDLLFHATYGAGLPQEVGNATTSLAVEAVVRRQMFTEPVVSQEPPPVVQATPILGGVVVRISYVDRVTSEPVPIGFTVER